MRCITHSVQLLCCRENRAHRNMNSNKLSGHVTDVAVIFSKFCFVTPQGAGGGFRVHYRQNLSFGKVFVFGGRKTKYNNIYNNISTTVRHKIQNKKEKNSSKLCKALSPWVICINELAPLIVVSFLSGTSEHFLFASQVLHLQLHHTPSWCSIRL